MSEAFDIEAEVARRVGDLGPPGAGPATVHLQALAVLIDASLSRAERGEGFAQLLARMLAQLCPDEARRFRELAAEQGEHAALVYLAEVTGGP